MSNKKKGVKGENVPIAGVVRERLDEEKAVAAISGFSDGKFKTERRELALCDRRRRARARGTHGGEASAKRTRRRSRQDLKLLSNDWLGARIGGSPLLDI